MNRIDRHFQECRALGVKALMPFVTAGDPDLATTAQLLPAIERAGGRIVELGIPFSDPIADGPIIQASMAHALDQNKVTAQQVLDMVAAVRSNLSLGLVAMVSYSIVYRLGPGRFVSDASRAGIDGLIVPDLSLEASETFRTTAAEAGLTCSFLIAPTTPIARARALASASSGFIYLLARAGLTGERSRLPEDLPHRIERIRQVTDLPIAVGFGISAPEQVRQVVQVADAAIVGSAIMRRIAEARDSRSGDLVDHVEQFVRSLAAGLTPEPATG